MCSDTLYQGVVVLPQMIMCDVDSSELHNMTPVLLNLQRGYKIGQNTMYDGLRLY